MLETPKGRLGCCLTPALSPARPDPRHAPREETPRKAPEGVSRARPGWIRGPDWEVGMGATEQAGPGAGNCAGRPASQAAEVSSSHRSAAARPGGGARPTDGRKEGAPPAPAARSPGGTAAGWKADLPGGGDGRNASPAAASSPPAGSRRARFGARTGRPAATRTPVPGARLDPVLPPPPATLPGAASRLPPGRRALSSASLPGRAGGGRAEAARGAAGAPAGLRPVALGAPRPLPSAAEAASAAAAAAGQGCGARAAGLLAGGGARGRLGRAIPPAGRAGLKLRPGWVTRRGCSPGRGGAPDAELPPRLRSS